MPERADRDANFQTRFENANNLVPVLRPLISRTTPSTSTPGNNALVITDCADNLQRIARIIASMDVAKPPTWEVIPLQPRHCAADLAPLLRASGGRRHGTSRGSGPAPRARPTPRTKPRCLPSRAATPSWCVRPTLARLAQIRIAGEQSSDQPPLPGSSAASGNIHVVYLKNADAVKLAVTLRAAPWPAMGGLGEQWQWHGRWGPARPARQWRRRATGRHQWQPDGQQHQGSSGGLGAGASHGPGAATTTSPPRAGRSRADPTTNSLIITAPSRCTASCAR